MRGSDIDGSVADTITLLWSDHDRPVGRTGRTIADFVDAATDMVRAEGLEALSMRAIAAQLGVRTMATYSFAPSKAALLALMVDRAYRGLYDDRAIEGGSHWRGGLTRVAEANRALLLANPWLEAARRVRSPMGPYEIAKNEVELAAVEGSGFSDFEMEQVLAAVLNHAAQAAKLESQVLAERRGSGLEDNAWWGEALRELERFVDPRRYPLTARVGRAATKERQGQFWSERAFRFGLDRLLDGIAVLIETR